MTENFDIIKAKLEQLQDIVAPYFRKANVTWNDEFIWLEITDRDGDMIATEEYPYKKSEDKYAAFKKLTPEDCKEIFDYAMQRSREILEGKDHD